MVFSNCVVIYLTCVRVLFFLITAGYYVAHRENRFGVKVLIMNSK